MQEVLELRDAAEVANQCAVQAAAALEAAVNRAEAAEAALTAAETHPERLQTMASGALVGAFSGPSCCFVKHACYGCTPLQGHAKSMEAPCVCCEGPVIV